MFVFNWMTPKVSSQGHPTPIPANAYTKPPSPICLCLLHFPSLPVSSVRRVWCVPHHSPRTACYHSNSGDREQENYRKTEIEWERVCDKEKVWEREGERSGCLLVDYTHASICVPFTIMRIHSDPLLCVFRANFTNLRLEQIILIQIETLTYMTPHPCQRWPLRGKIMQLNNNVTCP